MPVVPGDFGATAPEVNYYTLIAGDHAASCEAAAVAYQTLSDAVTAEMAVMASNTTMTAAQGWKGLGGSAMLMTAGTFEGVLGAAVAWLDEAFGAATNIATGYHAAEAGMIPGQVCDVNRATQMGLVATNWGQNTPAINALDGGGRGERDRGVLVHFRPVVRSGPVGGDGGVVLGGERVDVSHERG